MAQTANSITPLPKGVRPNIVAPILPQLGSPAILAWGDSTTYGETTNDPNPAALLANAWRFDLNTLVTTRGGLTPTWIGPQNRGQAPSNLCRAVVGASLADYLASGDPGNTLAAFDPDIVIILLGLNDADDAGEAAAFGANMVTFVTDIHNNRAGRRFVCIKPFDGGDATRRARLVTDIWPGFDAAMATLTGAGIAVVPVDGRVLTHRQSMILLEGTSAIHPRYFSYLQLADVAYPGLMNAAGFDATW